MTWPLFVLISTVLPTVVLIASLLVIIWMEALFKDPDTQDRVFMTLLLFNCVLLTPMICRWGSNFIEWAGNLG